MDRRLQKLLWIALLVAAALFVAGALLWLFVKGPAIIAPIVVRPRPNGPQRTWHRLFQRVVEKALVWRLIRPRPLHFQKKGTAHVHDDNVGDSTWGVLRKPSHRDSAVTVAIKNWNVVGTEEEMAA